MLFIYNEPNYESFLFVIWARLLGYHVIVDIVEDAYFIAAAAPFLSRLKARSARWATAHLHWFADGVVVISSYLKQKLEHIVGGRLPVALIPISVDLDRIRRVPGGFHRPAAALRRQFRRKGRRREPDRSVRAGSPPRDGTSSW